MEVSAWVTRRQDSACAFDAQRSYQPTIHQAVHRHPSSWLVALSAWRSLEVLNCLEHSDFYRRRFRCRLCE